MENKMTMEEMQRYIFDKRCQGNPPRTPREIYDCLQLAYEYGRMSMMYVYPSQSKEKTIVKNKMEKSIYDKNFKFEVDIKPQHVILPKLSIKNDIFERVEDIRGDFKECDEDDR